MGRIADKDTFEVGITFKWQTPNIRAELRLIGGTVTAEDLAHLKKYFTHLWDAFGV